MKPENWAVVGPPKPWQLPPDHFVIFPGGRAVNFFAVGCVDFSKGAEFSGRYWQGAQKKTRRGPLKLPARPAASLVVPLPKGTAAPETYYECGDCQMPRFGVRYFDSCGCCQGCVGGVVTAVGIGCRPVATRQRIAMRWERNALMGGNNLAEVVSADVELNRKRWVRS